MKILALLLSVTLMVLLAVEAVELHTHTVCRQEAWRSSVTLHTRARLSRAPSLDKDVLFRCRIIVTRQKNKVTFFSLRSRKRYPVELSLGGHL